MTELKQIIDELQEEFAKGKSVFWSKKSLVNLDRCEELIAEIKRKLPNAFQEASYICSQKEKILSQAEEQSRRTLKEAEEKAEYLVQESDLVKRSESEAQEIVEQTEKKCQIMYQNTKENIDKLLKAIEDYLVDNLHIVRNNREELSGALLMKKKDPSRPGQN